MLVGDVRVAGEATACCGERALTGSRAPLLNLCGHGEKDFAPLPRLLLDPFHACPSIQALVASFKGMCGQDHNPKFRSVAISTSCSLLTQDTSAPPLKCFSQGYSSTDLSFGGLLRELIQTCARGVQGADAGAIASALVDIGREYDLEHGSYGHSGQGARASRNAAIRGSWFASAPYRRARTSHGVTANPPDDSRLLGRRPRIHVADIHPQGLRRTVRLPVQAPRRAHPARRNVVRGGPRPRAINFRYNSRAGRGRGARTAAALGTNNASRFSIVGRGNGLGGGKKRVQEHAGLLLTARAGRMARPGSTSIPMPCGTRRGSASSTTARGRRR